jgi:hypothetical protein
MKKLLGKKKLAPFRSGEHDQNLNFLVADVRNPKISQ